MKNWLVFIVYVSVNLSFGQQVDALVYFIDKPNVVPSLSNPQTILTQRALDRKNRHGVGIDERDVPVNQAYVNQIKNMSGIDYRTQSKWFNCMHVVGSVSSIEALELLPFVREVEFADPTLNRNTITEVNKYEDLITTPIAYGTASNQIEMIGLDDLHDQGFAGNNMIIALTDSGFPNVDGNPGFQQLRDNNGLLGGYDFVAKDNSIYEDHFHGSRVLSVMAGSVTGQYEGTAPDAGFYLFRTEDTQSETPVEMSYWVAAAERADSLGVDVINVSLGYLGFDNPSDGFTYQDMDGQTTFISKGSNIAYEKGLMVVTSAGNSGNSAVHPYIAAPADATGSFSIGGVDDMEQRSSFSSIGPTIDGRTKPNVVARASSTITIDEVGNIVGSSGTSFSAPLVSGAVACLMQAFPDMTAQEIRSAIENSASQSTNPDVLVGYGIPDFGNAFRILNNEPVLRDGYTFINDGSSLQIASLDSQELGRIELYDLSGRMVISVDVPQTTYVIPHGTFTTGLYIISISKFGESRKLLLK
ncbi:MAG: S8 family serine peptidase [Nonlabens sp.]